MNVLSTILNILSYELYTGNVFCPCAVLSHFSSSVTLEPHDDKNSLEQCNGLWLAVKKICNEKKLLQFYTMKYSTVWTGHYFRLAQKHWATCMGQHEKNLGWQQGWYGWEQTSMLWVAVFLPWPSIYWKLNVVVASNSLIVYPDYLVQGFLNC
jgi:hypothetical protein